MITYLDNLLRHLFIAQINEITIEDQVRFRPPDEDWRNEVSNLQQIALNVYLVDLRENRTFRSNQRVRHLENGFINETPSPRRMDCHYLITVWSPPHAGAAGLPFAE